MKQISLIFLLLFANSLSAQIKVVNKDLRGIEGVQVMDNNKVIGVSDKSGFIDITVQDIESSYIILLHQGFYQKRVLSSELEPGINSFLLNSKTSSFPMVVVRPPPSRQNRDKNETPLLIEQITDEDIQFYQPPTMAEAISIGQKVFVQKSQAGGGSPILRGFATNRILLVVDDVRMNTAIFRSGNVQNVVSIDPNSLSQTDVLFGPASQLYGSDAIGGVLSFKTKDPQLGKEDSIVYEGNVGLRIGSANIERSWHFDFNVGGEKLGSFTSLSFNSYGHAKMGENGPKEYTRPTYVSRFNDKDTQAINPDPNNQLFSNYNQLNALQKLVYVHSAHLKIGYNFHYSQTSDVNRFDRLLLTDNAGNLTNAQWYYGPQKWMMNHFNLVYDNDKILFDHFKINIANQRFEESRNDRKFGSQWLRNRTENVIANSVNFDLEKSLNQRATLNYGFEYVHNLVNSSALRSNVEDNSVAATSTRYPDGATWQSSGVYLNFFNKWSRKWITEAGVRYNWVTAQALFDTNYFKFQNPDFINSSQAFTGSVSQLYKSGKGQIGVVMSTAFRSPNIDDLAKVFDSNPGLVIIPNSDLEPEYAINFELNGQRKFGKNLKLQSSIFYTRLLNALATTNAQFNGADSILYDGILSQVQQLQNLEFAEIAGIQLNAEFLFNENWKASSNFTFLESGFDGNQPVRHITPNFGGTQLSYEKDNWILSLYSHYNLEFAFENFSINEQQDAYLYVNDENGNPYSPSWGTINLRGSYQWTENVSLNLAAENLTNKRYRPYSSGITAPGLNIIVSMRARF